MTIYPVGCAFLAMAACLERDDEGLVTACEEDPSLELHEPLVGLPAPGPIVFDLFDGLLKMDNHRILIFGEKLPALIYGGQVRGTRTLLPIHGTAEETLESHPLGLLFIHLKSVKPCSRRSPSIRSFSIVSSASFQIGHPYRPFESIARWSPSTNTKLDAWTRRLPTLSGKEEAFRGGENEIMRAGNPQRSAAKGIPRVRLVLLVNVDYWAPKPCAQAPRCCLPTGRALLPTDPLLWNPR